MKLDMELFTWLQSLELIREDAQYENNYAILHQDTWDRLLDGKIVADLINKIDSTIVVEIKQTTTLGLKLFNWNNLMVALQRVNIHIDDDIKCKIMRQILFFQLVQMVKGNKEMIIELLRDIKQSHFQKQETQSIFDNQTSTERQVSEPAELQIDKLDLDKPLQNSQSLLEFTLLTLCNSFKLKPKQAVLLLEKNHKQLSSILIMGYKNGFKTVVNWLIELHKYIPIILRFSYHIDTFYSLIRAGLLSRSSDVAYWCLFIYQVLTEELAKVQLEDTYSFFVREHGGLITTLLCLRRHPQLTEGICNLIAIIAQYNIKDFFDVQLRKILKSGKEYIDAINSIIETIQIKDQLQEYGLIEFFGQHAFKLFDPIHSMHERMTALKYLEHYWIIFPDQFEKTNVDAYLMQARKATREVGNFTLRIFTFQSLFRILDHLAMNKNRYAALIYKKLVFALIENFDEKEIREFLVANLLWIIRKYSSIPIDILIQPMMKQIAIEESDFKVNVGDFALLREVCTHPKLDLETAILMLNVLGKIYLQSVAYYQPVLQQMQLLFSRFIESIPLQEFAISFSDKSLNSYYNSYVEYVKNFAKSNIFDQDNKIYRQQARSQIILLVKYLIGLGNPKLNQQIQNQLLHYYLEIKTNAKNESKALIMLIGQFGNLSQLLEEYSINVKRDERKVETSRIVEPKIIKQQQKKTPSDDPFKELRKAEEVKPQQVLLQTMALSYDEQQLLKQFELL